MATSRRGRRATLPSHCTDKCGRLGQAHTWLARSRTQRFSHQHALFGQEEQEGQPTSSPDPWD
eukprot:1955909-Lingulodinium_polyedra.AAC.1